MFAIVSRRSSVLPQSMAESIGLMRHLSQSKDMRKQNKGDRIGHRNAKVLHFITDCNTYYLRSIDSLSQNLLNGFNGYKISRNKSD